MKNLRRHFAFAPDSEITLEANPDDITADKLALFRDLGINRLSLGVQSFDEAELRFLGAQTHRQADGGGPVADPGRGFHQPGAGPRCMGCRGKAWTPGSRPWRRP